MLVGREWGRTFVRDFCSTPLAPYGTQVRLILSSPAASGAVVRVMLSWFFAMVALTCLQGQLSPEGDLAFTVTLLDDRGLPWADLPVGVGRRISTGNSSYWRGITRMRTDSSGRIWVEPLDDWVGGEVLSLDLREAGLMGACSPDWSLDWDGAPGAACLTVPRLGWVTGRVTRRSAELPVSAEPLDEPSQGLKNLELDDAGRFRLGPIAPGKRAISFNYGLMELAVTFDVPPGADSEEALVDLNDGGWIVGRAVGADGRPLTGRSLALASPEIMNFSILELLRLSTDAVDGTFALGPLAPGLYPVQVYDQGPLFAVAHAWVEVPARGEVQVELRARAGPVTLRGVVLAGGEAAAERLVVARLDGTHQSVQIRSDALGRFELTVPLPGVYRFQCGGFRTECFDVSGQIQDVTIDLPLNALEVALPGAGDPAKPWRLRYSARGRNPWEQGSFIASSKDGTTMRAEGLNPGSYRIVGIRGQGAEAHAYVDVPESGEVRVAFGETEWAPMEYRFRGPGGRPLESVSCCVVDCMGFMIPETQRLPEGRYSMLARPWDGSALGAITTFEVAGTETHVVEVTLGPAAKIVVLGSSDGLPVSPQVRVVHSSGMPIGTSFFDHGVTGPGRVEVAGLPPGRYEAFARLPGGDEMHWEVQLSAGQAAEWRVGK